MIDKFNATIYTENHRSFIKIPFNVWEKTGLKGNISCKISILDISFECKLIPKGSGEYLIPITKKTLSMIEPKEEYEILMEPIEKLSRINHDSKYSRKHPIRKIDSIEIIPIPTGLCGHCCVAMLAGVALSEVVTLMGKNYASWSKILEALDYYGISYASKAVYTKGRSYQLPMCCIVNNNNRFILWYKDSFCGVTEVDLDKTISYMEILVD